MLFCREMFCGVLVTVVVVCLRSLLLLNKNSSNQRNLFSATKRLLNQGHEVPFPLTSDKLVLLEPMKWGAPLLKRLIPLIHAKLDRLANCLHDSNFDYVNTSSPATPDSFIPLAESSVGKFIGCFTKKSCVFDPMCQHLW